MSLADYFRDLLKDNDPLNTIGVWLGVLVLALIFHFILFRVFRYIADKYNSRFFFMITEKLKIPVLLLFMIIATNLLVPFLGFFSPMERIIRQTLSILAIAFVAWLFILSVSVIRKFALRKYKITEKDNLRARVIITQFNMMEKILEFIIIIIAIGIALMTFEQIRKIGMSLLASAGIAGLIIGFAAQRIIATMLAGFQIAITQPIRIDDVVIVEGEWGWIEEIHLTFVVIKIWDKRRLIVPTTYFIEKPFQNWTRTSASIMGTVFIHTDYNMPIDKLREELTLILQSTPLWDGQINVLQVTDAKEKTIELRALMSAVDSPSSWDLRVYVREKLVEYVQKNNPESFPRYRVEITNKSNVI
ncbi:MAG: mechanosensitive ion channel [Bacteroidetes bacterium]|nr:mechanosensitive ion channel [Bacteroidota bacterium]HET6242981.1 mechanosensitive ion channel domain-containing protein [Bacteroidia bacterium]